LSRAKDLTNNIKESMGYPLSFSQQQGEGGTGYPLNFATNGQDGEGTRIKNTQTADRENPVFDPDDEDAQQLSGGQQADDDDFD